jgi:hypothetical protein
MRPRPLIEHIVTMGDSLSDRGTLANRYLFGCLPMSYLSGLTGTSPDGRFTNGLAWDDHFSAALANEFTIKRLEKKKHTTANDLEGILDPDPRLERRPHVRYHLDGSDIADGVIDGNKQVKRQVQSNYYLDNSRRLRYRGLNFVRSYNEGGLSAHNYRWSLSSSIKRFFTRLILSNLDQKREELLKDDRTRGITAETKAKTLVIEWSGANDLITMNAEPSILEVDRAIQDRIKNAEKLIAQGYQHFMLFNLPDLSLTPRYQAKSQAERDKAHACCVYFNRQLKAAVANLKARQPACTIEVYDVASKFKDIYDHPEHYHLDSTKRAQPYITSPDFRLRSNGTSPAKGYLFWDDIHPSATMHAELANNFYRRYQGSYQFTAPKPLNEVDLYRQFMRAYNRKWAQDRQGFFGFFRSSKLKLDFANSPNVLVAILKHALYHGGNRTRKLLEDLGWLNTQGKVNESIPALKNAMRIINLENAAAPKAARTCFGF